MSELHLIVPGAEPFFFPGGPTGCLLLHGFTAMPEEMRWLGEYLAGQGHSVLGARLAGHATDPRDLARVRWTDWLVSVEEGLALLRGVSDRVFVIGLSMGGALALLAARLYPVAGVVAMSTPADAFSSGPRWMTRLYARLRPMIHKPFDEAEGPLAGRREADYPAYPQFPPDVILALGDMIHAMRAGLPDVKVPVLLIHSAADGAVPVESMQRIYDNLGSADKEMLLVEDMDHSLVRDPKRQVVFEAVARFLAAH
jgi:carboxylesterase